MASDLKVLTLPNTAMSRATPAMQESPTKVGFKHPMDRGPAHPYCTLRLIKSSSFPNHLFQLPTGGHQLTALHSLTRASKAHALDLMLWLQSSSSIFGMVLCCHVHLWSASRLYMVLHRPWQFNNKIPHNFKIPVPPGFSIAANMSIDVSLWSLKLDLSVGPTQGFQTVWVSLNCCSIHKQMGVRAFLFATGIAGGDPLRFQSLSISLDPEPCFNS